METMAATVEGPLLRWKRRNDGEEEEEHCLEIDSEVLGYQAQGRTLRVKSFAPTSCCRGGGGRRKCCSASTTKEFVFQLGSEEATTLLAARLAATMDSLGRPKRLFILLNPFGGKKCARKIFHKQVAPLLLDANIFYTLQETNYQLHAQEIIHSLDLLKYDGIVCISGDGILVEVVNGLLGREDWKNTIKMPLGIIPAGTGNGMAKSLVDAVRGDYSIANSVFNVIRGHKRSLDVVTVSQEATKFFSVLMLTWGFIADIDIESEKYRWMGSARLNFYTLLRIMNLRKYHGHVQFIAAPGYEFLGEPIRQDANKKEIVNVPNCHEVSTTCLHKGYQGPAADMKDVEWRSLAGPFILVWASNVPWSVEDVKQAPEAKFSDGYLDVVIVRNCSRMALAWIMWKISDGSHIKSPHVIYLKVKAFRLQPGQRVGDPRKGSVIDSDGEVIARWGGGQQQLMAYGPQIEMVADRGLATIFSPRLRGA